MPDLTTSPKSTSPTAMLVEPEVVSISSDLISPAPDKESLSLVTQPLSTDYGTLESESLTSSESLNPSESLTPEVLLSTKKVTPEVTKHKNFKFLPRVWQKVLFIFLLLVVFVGSLGGVLVFQTYSVAQDLKLQALQMKDTAKTAYEQLKTQNLPEVELTIIKLKSQLEVAKLTYSKLSYYASIPVVGNYYSDGNHAIAATEHALSAALKSLQAVTPYADVLGFKGEGSYVGGGTTEDRLRVILETLAKIMPIFDEITTQAKGVQSELAMIDPARYPEEFSGFKLQSSIKQAQQVGDGVVIAMTKFRPTIEKIPSLAGGNKQRKKYMFLFQNDNELRPTGGFLTAFAIVYVEDGKVSPDKSDDIYEMDKKFTKKLPIPPVLGKYLTTEKKFNIRDMNIYPDFKQSMDLFTSNYKQVKGEPADIDGVIAIDTHMLVDLLTVLGPVDVPGYGTFTVENEPKCDCPQIIYALSEIITRPTPYIREDRKGIIGPMMRAILTKAYTAPKTLWPEMFSKAWENVEGRHVQAYFFDESSQHAVEVIGAAGRMEHSEEGTDFLAVIDANLGGAKSNLFVTSEIKQEVSAPQNGQLTKKVTLTYKNSHKADNCNLEAGKLCLNSTLRDWHRMYLPKGSALIESKGFKEGTVKSYDEGNFTVIDGEFSLEPMAQARLEVSYTVPYKDSSKYKIQLWKQGGVDKLPVEFDVNGNQEKIELLKDTVYEVAF